MSDNVNMAGKPDAKGLAKLIHLDSLPTVWLPPGEMRDKRELHLDRMALSQTRTALTSTQCPLGRTASTLPWPHMPWRAVPGNAASPGRGHSDIFTGPGWARVQAPLCRLPPETGRCVAQKIEAVDELQPQITRLEARIRDRVALTPSVQLLTGPPGETPRGVAIVIERQIGRIDRFPSPGQLASHAGLVPTVHASGGIAEHPGGEDWLRPYA
jgi:transposase